ncbi:protein of unknown function [Xenorhabdus poinarii G6]|uniref:DUF1266 domain-containing protein n=1 Tax=Xenorhabdus poinarii G6 TaxID=1354304 RepID=A0A068R2K0_9GAMM|nr:DUF1266 domain-containing protein [Xenorhabdus poinarii]CDG21146.1 protein of unknown function [Xenorhabdus poinarii G6]
MHWFLRTAVFTLVLLGVSYSIYSRFFPYVTNENRKEEIEVTTQNTLLPVTSEDWGIILGAPYAVFNGHVVNDYTPEIAEDNGLSSAWGIKNRQDLLQQLFWLIMEGHSTDYYEIRDTVIHLSKNDFDMLLSNIEKSQWDETEKQELIWQYKMMYHNTHDIQNMEYLAWDYVRFSMLCLEGARLKYITKEEAQSWTRMLAPRLRKMYTGWDDLWHHLFITRWFWSAQDKQWTSSQSDYLAIVDNLLQDKSSPVNVIQWDVPLSSTDTTSFSEALVSLQLPKSMVTLELEGDDDVTVGVDELNEIIRAHLNISPPK